MNTQSSKSRNASPAPLPALRLLTPPEDSAASLRLPMNARDHRSGEDFYFTADQVTSIEPTRDGCILRLRRGRWVFLALKTTEASKLVWGPRAA